MYIKIKYNIQSRLQY